MSCQNQVSFLTEFSFEKSLILFIFFYNNIVHKNVKHELKKNILKEYRSLLSFIYSKNPIARE